MGGGHGASAQDRVVAGASRVHRADPAAKLAGLLAFVVLVALTPRRAVGALIVDGVVLGAVVALAGIPASTIVRRLVAVVPFVAFALVLPLIGTGPRTEVAGVSLSVDGIWASWNIVAKALLGATAAIVLTATTPLPDLLVGAQRLRVPRSMVAIASFMARYLDLVADELGRMRRAMVARGHDPRWLWQVRPIASSVGALFVRSYERGERVHLAMAARGFDGTMPPVGEHAPSSAWSVLGALVPAALAATALLLASFR